MNPEARKYLTDIGRKGGQKSRRKLTKAQARAMVRARTATRLCQIGWPFLLARETSLRFFAISPAPESPRE